MKFKDTFKKNMLIRYAYSLDPYTKKKRICPYYYTQIELAGGLFSSFRIGFNPGEVIDLLLGFLRVDIFDDDIGVVKIDKFKYGYY